MKQLLLTVIAVGAMTLVGCRHHNLAPNCNSCGDVKHAATAGGGDVQLANYGAEIAAEAGDCNCGDHAHGNIHAHQDLRGHGFAGLRNPQAVPRMGHHQYPPATGPAGPSSAQVGYPYYTTRGPRDFLMSNPPSIGY